MDLSRLTTTLLLALILLLRVNLAGAQTSSDTPPDTNRRQALKALGAYSAAQDKLKNAIIHYEESKLGDCRLPPPYDAHNGKIEEYEAGEVRRDGNRYSVRFLTWGRIGSSDQFISKAEAFYKSMLFDGKRRIQYDWAPKSRVTPQGIAFITTCKAGEDAEYNNFWQGPSVLDGRLHDDNDRIDKILRQADELSLAHEKDANGSTKNVILRARTRRGQYAVWLDPTRGYNITRAEIHREGGDFIGEKNPLPQGFKTDCVLSDVTVRKIGEVWVPMEATETFYRKHPADHYTRMATNIKRTQVDLAPDFASLRAFEPDDIRDGSRVSQDDSVTKLGSWYTWQKGALILQPKRKSTTQSSKHPQPGTTAPDFTLKTVNGKEFKLSGQRGKVVILHFWSAMNRDCIQRNPELRTFYQGLAKRYGEKVVMLGLALDDDEALILAFAQSDKLGWPQACLGKNSKIAADYGVTSVPDSFMIGPDGKILLNRESKGIDTNKEIDKALGL